MIWSLAREQVRSQRRYLLSAALVIAVTVAVAAYGALMALTFTNSQLEIDHFLGYDRDSAADASTFNGGDFEDIAPNVEEANAEGHDVVAVAYAWPTLRSANPYSSTTDLVALYGDVDWSTILVEGSAPEPGEIVVNAQWADENDVALGDTTRLAITSNGINTATDPYPSVLTPRISGISRSPVGTSGIELYVPGGFVAWDDVPSLNQAASDRSDVTSAAGITVYGNGNWPWSETLALSATPNGPSSSPALAIAIIAGIGTAALVIGLIAMAFALGRAQAQARTKWVGTVRALGATKRQVASASLLESAVVGVAAGVVGFLLGVSGTVVHLAIIASRVASPAIFAATAGYMAIAAGAVVLAILLALIVGAVPAFWSARVAPTAALKPATDLSDAKVSRDIKVWPLATAWLVSILLVAIGARGGLYGPLAIVTMLASLVIAVTTLMLAHEVLRRSLPWHARRMSRSARRAVMVAGDAILARPRQFTIPAFIVALSTTVTLSLFAQLAASWSAEMSYQELVAGYPDPSPNPYIAPLPLLGVYAVVTLLCVAVAIATASVSAREAATREALGLTEPQGRLAAALQYLVAQGHGLALGLLGGGVGGMVTIALNMDNWRDTFDWWIGAVAGLFALATVIAGLFAVLGATIVSALAPRTAPLSRVEVSA